jgi:hypothetical protein
MRLHTKLSRKDITEALNQASYKRHISWTVVFDPMEEHKSTTHPRAFEIQLGSEFGGNLPDYYVNRYGKRQKARRTRNISVSTAYKFSATWEEWGWFIAEIYKRDINARWGGVKRPIYSSYGDFHSKTGFKFTER